jgi:PAS domain S-box-containing protein
MLYDPRRNETERLVEQVRDLESRLAEAEDTIEAIRGGGVDAVLVNGRNGRPRVFTLESGDRPYRVLVEQMREGAVTLAADGTILYCNHRLAGMLGMPRARVIGQSLGTFLRTGGALDYPAFLREARSAGVRREMRLHPESGGEIAVFVSLGLLHDEDQADLLCGVLTDLTEQKQHLRDLADANARLQAEIAEREHVEAVLRQAHKMEAIGTLAGGMAHDFNNLLSVIILNLDFVGQLLAGAEDARVHVNEALDAANRGADLTRSLLAFARRQSLHPVRIDLNDMVTGMHRMLSRLLGETTEISLDLDAAIWPVVADRPQVITSIVNLATNARDAMPKGGKLVITTRNRHLDAQYAARHNAVRPGDYAMIAVSDSGCGMTEDLLAKIFEPFFTTKAQGTGLGLSMVFGFVSQSAGHLTAVSAPGAGTTIRLFLPRAADSPPPPAPAVDLALPAGHRCKPNGETVLVVEDNPAVRRVVVHELTALRFRVLEAENPRAALAVLEREPVDLLFSDVVMPGGLDGFDLRDLVLARWPHVRVLLTSGFAGAPAGERQLPAIGLLSKPYHRSELAAAIRGLLDMCSERAGSS